MRRSRSLKARLRRLERATPQGPTIREIHVYGPVGEGGLTIMTIPVGPGETTRRTATPEEARAYYVDHLHLDWDALMRGDSQ